ncbi:MAG: DUF5107 domain-containing protein [Candidatus Aminicenantes bacterium]|nr:DUF5107 domain-containing protein [Candidatus Aminicenantes bacterium]
MKGKKYLLIMPLLLGFFLLNLTAISLHGDSSVKVWEEALVIPTYRIGKPDLNPIFYTGRAYQGAKGPVYPYPLLDKITDVREEKAYRALYLENDYVKICVLPEIGGRIFSALDKTNNYDFFYCQHVIKPALIGMLGAWISGGVEWNFPHHHRATGFMNVDYTLTENADGSKTIWVGEIELRHRMKWIIGLTLHPDRSYIEATIKLFNRTPFAHSFLCWANVAVHTNLDYQIIFPPSTEFATYHGKNQFSHWPVSYDVFNRVDYTKGVDVSWWKNHPEPTSFFAWNCKEDFLAGYDHGKEAGVVHFADHNIVPGKKFWTWGTGERGKIWEKILTETDGPYIELMVGAYSDNQPDYSWLQPYEVRTVKQYWYPIRQIGGVKNANLKAACNLEITSKKRAKIGFNTTSGYKGARAVLKSRKKVFFEQKIDISPEKPFWKEVGLPEDVDEENLELLLFSPANKILISYNPKKKERVSKPEPVKPPQPPEKIKTVEELYLAGLRLEQFHNPALEPYPYYEEALKRDPDNSIVNTALAILYLKRGMFKEAEDKLNRALSGITNNYTSPKNGEAYYYLGVVLRAQGKDHEAFETFYKATWSKAWGAAGYYSLAELSCQKRDFSKALNFLNRSLLLNALNTKAQNFKAAVLRRLGRLEEAEKIALEVLAFDPLDFWAANEFFLVKTAKGLKSEAVKVKKILEIKQRDSIQSYLELAVDYGNCGLLDEAIRVLSEAVEPDRKSLSAYPMLYYYLGYYLEKKGEKDKALEYYKLASKMPPDYCFPFRAESIDVLNVAQKNNPVDACAPYYLGNLLYDIQPQRAIKEWEKSRILDKSFSIVHRNLGLAYARVENDVSKAITSLEEAVACNREEPRFYLELDLLYETGGISAAKRLAVLEKNQNIVLQRDYALSREITLFVQLGKYEEAINLLKSFHFHVWEGGGRIHNVYVDAYLLRGQAYFTATKYRQALKDFKAALEYPENLEVGRPSRGGRASQVYYFIGTVYEVLGDTRKAKEFYEKSVALKHSWSQICYFQGLAFKKLGREKEASQMFDGLIQSGEERLRATRSMDYFAKFGERQSVMVRRANAFYLLGLGYQGKGELEKAKNEYKKALELNINHVWAKHQLAQLNR